jgi:hypothetical protein
VSEDEERGRDDSERTIGTVSEDEEPRDDSERTIGTVSEDEERGRDDSERTSGTVSEDEERGRDDSERTMSTMNGDEAPKPVLRVVRGEPTAEELAALVTVLAARSTAAAAAGRRAHAEARSLWRDRSRNVRPPLSAGPGAWRASGLPR